MRQRKDNHGSGEDFESVATREYPTLKKAATVLCWLLSDVDDVVQETMLNAHKSYASFRGDSSFLTWCYRILARAAHAANRRRFRVVPVEDVEDRPVELPPVDQSIMLDEEAREAVDAIRSLPDRQREMMTWYLLKGASYAEIAEAAEVSLGTVKATLYEAKKSLRAKLAKKGINRNRIHELP